jgi:hypothetical protein
MAAENFGEPMIEDSIIEGALQPTMDRADTPEQAQLRSCVQAILQGREDVELVRICHELITLMRDQLSTQVATVRRKAALEARERMSSNELSVASGQSIQTIARLLDEARRFGY